MIVNVLSLLFLLSSPPSLLDGDQEFVRINYSSAAAIYHSVLTGAHDSASVLWRLARVYVCMADISPIEQQIGLYRQAEEYAQRCIHADSMISEGHAWRAAALGNIAMSEGGKTKVKLTHEIKQELDVAIALDQRNDIAYSILGSFYLALGNVSWIERQLANIFLGSLPDGGYEEAEQALKKAIAIAPNVVRHHFELGRVYMEMDRMQEAMEELRIAISLPVQLGVDTRTQESARRLAKEIQEG
jgi:tetratricopeptide (TPR) repeat protein